MFLKALSLKDVRPYEKAYFEFSPSLNVIVGNNAIGKTTILEAIWLLVTGRSFRASHQKEMIRCGAPSFSVDALFVKHGVEQRIKIQTEGHQKRCFYNRIPLASPSALLGHLQGVVMTPDGTSLVKGSPKGRREYLDLYLAQKDPLYVHHLSRFYRAMQQRNCQLRSKQIKGLSSWEKEMAVSGVYLIKKRQAAAGELTCWARDFFEMFGGGGTLQLNYQTLQGEISESSFLDHLKRQLKRELILGTTLTGPHKDDLHIVLGGESAKGFGSEGQIRLAVFAMHLAVWEGMKQESGLKPLMLVDDFALSLDETRKMLFLKSLEKLGQVFLTTTHPIESTQGNLLKLG